MVLGFFSSPKSRRYSAPCVSRASLVIFTDASLTGIGVCFVWPSGRCEYFGADVPQKFASSFPKGSNQIYILEIWAVYLAARLLEQLRSVHTGMRILIFVDNNAALSAFIKAAASSFPAGEAIHRAWQIFERLEVVLWFERVPSHLNLADAPSRGKGSFLKKPFPFSPSLTMPTFLCARTPPPPLPESMYLSCLRRVV